MSKYYASTTCFSEADTGAVTVKADRLYHKPNPQNKPQSAVETGFDRGTIVHNLDVIQHNAA